MLYRLAAGTGFRSEELQGLTPESFDLSAECPTVTIETTVRKRRRRDVQPIHAALPAGIGSWLAGRPEDRRLFPVDRWAILAALQADENAAGIEFENREGFADFHALRRPEITALAKSNVPVKVVQSLARHSTPVLMLGAYAHLHLYGRAPALDALPDLGAPASTSEPSALAATGTDSVAADSQKLTEHWQGVEGGSGWEQSGSDVISGSTVPALMEPGPLKKRCSGAHSRVLTVGDD
jgi:hypothetical protein